MPAQPYRSDRLLSDDDQLQSGFHVGVQVHGDVELTGVAQRAVGQANFGFFQRVTGSGNGFGDVAGADRAEQLAFVASVGAEGYHQLGELGSTGFGSGLLLGGSLFQLGAACFERSDVLGGGDGGLALRQQEVTGLTALDVHLVA